MTEEFEEIQRIAAEDFEVDMLNFIVEYPNLKDFDAKTKNQIMLVVLFKVGYVAMRKGGISHVAASEYIMELCTAFEYTKLVKPEEKEENVTTNDLD